MPYYVYLLASDRNGTLYLGVTNDIVRRVYEHKSKAVAGFTKRYAVDKQVWFELYDDPTNDHAREGIEEVATSVEDSADRRAKSTLDRSISASIDLTLG
jgi:hypothetical protein